MNQDSDHLPDRWRRIIQLVARGEDWRAAAMANGCSASYAKVLRTRMMKRPAVAKAIEEIRKKGREMAAYGLVEAMQEADSAAAFAREKGNSMALVKAVELRSKLSGLLIDRIEVVPVDLLGALAAAERRVIIVNPLGAQRLEGPARWAPRVPGDEKPDAGPTDGHVGN